MFTVFNQHNSITHWTKNGFTNVCERCKYVVNLELQICIKFALSAKVWPNTYICWIGIDTQKWSKCNGLIQIWYIFAAWANLQHFYQFTQIYILGKNDSFHFTLNAGKNIAKPLICSGICSCFSRKPKEHFCMWFTRICLKSGNNKFLDIWLYHKFAHLHHNYPYL